MRELFEKWKRWALPTRIGIIIGALALLLAAIALYYSRRSVELQSIQIEADKPFLEASGSVSLSYCHFGQFNTVFGFYNRTNGIPSDMREAGEMGRLGLRIPLVMRLYNRSKSPISIRQVISRFEPKYAYNTEVFWFYRFPDEPRKIHQFPLYLEAGMEKFVVLLANWPISNSLYQKLKSLREDTLVSSHEILKVHGENSNPQTHYLGHGFELELGSLLETDLRSLLKFKSDDRLRYDLEIVLSNNSSVLATALASSYHK